jgi:hypothetical protein
LTFPSYARLRAPGAFSEELLEKILRGVSAQVFGVSPSSVSQKDGGADGPTAEGVPRAVLGGVHAVRAVPGHNAQHELVCLHRVIVPLLTLPPALKKERNC